MSRAMVRAVGAIFAIMGAGTLAGAIVLFLSEFVPPGPHRISPADIDWATRVPGSEGTRRKAGECAQFDGQAYHRIDCPRAAYFCGRIDYWAELYNDNRAAWWRPEECARIRQYAWGAPLLPPRDKGPCLLAGSCQGNGP